MIPVMMANRRRRQAAPPTVLSASINATGTNFTVVFSEAVSGHTGFALTFGDVSQSITYDSGDGTDVFTFLTDPTTLPQNGTGTYTYTPGDVVSVADSVPLDAIGATSVTNNITRTIISAEITSDKLLRVTFRRTNNNVGASVGDGSWIAIKQGSTTILTDADATGATSSTNVVDLEFPSTFIAATAYTITCLHGAFINTDAGSVDLLGLLEMPITPLP